MSLLTYGPLSFLDVYSFNDYGLTWPLSVDTAGFVLALQWAQLTKAQGRPLLITEWGVNGWPGSAAAQAGAPARDQLELAQAELLYEKWVTMETLGAAGGFTYIWVDPLNHDLPVPNYLTIVSAVEYPPGSGYHPLNEEEFWGINDVNRRPRAAHAALRYAYTGEGQAPIVGLAAASVASPVGRGRGLITPPSGGPHAASALRSLHVDGRALRDSLDREVLLRGIAVIEKSPPYLPAVGPADFARIRSWGLNSIRLGISWVGVMPSEGEIDHAHLAALRRIVDDAAAAGLYVIVDMHQDVYGEPWGNGAPEWAARTSCPHTDWASLTGSWAANYFSPAVVCAFTNFWLDANLQSLYAAAWRSVAAAVGDSPAVVGYDLMNEPYQGLIPPAIFETAYLYPSQTRWLEAIRRVDADAVGFLEPANAKNVHLPTTPALAPAPNSVFAPHVYGLWDASPQLAPTRPLADVNVIYSRLEAAAMGLPLWFGEFGILADAPGATDFVSHVFDLADQAKAGAAYWAYGLGGGYTPLNSDGTERPLLSAIVRAYPGAVPGAITSIHFDAATRGLEVAWTQTASGDAVFEAPARLYPNGLTVTGAPSWEYDPTAGVVTVHAGPGSHRIVMHSRGA